MKGYCLRCKYIGVEMSDTWLCVDCVKELREGTRKGCGPAIGVRGSTGKKHGAAQTAVETSRE